jgi:hypothetical protein
MKTDDAPPLACLDANVFLAVLILEATKKNQRDPLPATSHAPAFSTLHRVSLGSPGG